MRPVRRLQILILSAVSLIAISGLLAQVRSDSISGRVVGQSGEAVAGVPVRLMGGISPPRWATTRQDGTFTFSGVKPAVYSVFAEAPGFVSSAELPRLRPGDVTTITLVPAGVITGRVTDQSGDPVIEIGVATMLTRSSEGALPRIPGYGQASLTDDRGIYRIYGLAPGRYVVSANGGTSGLVRGGEYADELPVFYPSDTKAAATEIEIGPGQEVAGIDIKYRAVTGRSISGFVEGGPVSHGNEMRSAPQVSVYQLPEKIMVKLAGGMIQRDDDGEFIVPGLADGDYELVAQRFSRDESYSSVPYRIKLQGSDVKGIKLKLQPLGFVSGTVAIERSTDKASSCPNPRVAALEEIQVRLVSAETPWAAVSVTGKGDFHAVQIKPGTVRIVADLPGEHFYVKSISAPKPADVERKGIDIQFGQRITGVAMTISQDGAQVSGKVTGGKRKRVFLVPAESRQADMVHRYLQTVTGSDGSFSMGNIAPGEYFFYSGDYIDSSEHPLLSFQFDDKARTRLRELSSQFGTRVSLSPCQRLKL